MGKKSVNSSLFVIDNLETLKVIADPLRWQILELLVLNAMTVKELGEKLGLAPSKLYYHISQLEEHGLVSIAETRIVSGIIEKRYQATAEAIDIDPALLSFSTDAGRDNIHTVLLATIDATREDLLRSLQARAFELEQGAAQQPRHVLVNRALSRIPEEQAEAFKHRLKELIQEFSAADAEDADQAFALTIAYYPAFYYRDIGSPSS